MSMSRLARATDLEKYWSVTADHSDSQVRITSVDRGVVPDIETVENYPFQSQAVLNGEFDYRAPSSTSGSQVYSGDYQYRIASGLLIVNGETDRINEREVLRGLDKILDKDVQINSALSFSRRSLWQFLEAAESISTLVLRGEEGTYDARVLYDLLGSSSPIDELLKGQYSNRPDREALASVIERLGTDQNVSSLFDLDLDLSKTAIKEVEADYFYDSGFATFKYKRGSFEIEAEDTGVREYILQLFERDLLK